MMIGASKYFISFAVLLVVGTGVCTLDLGNLQAAEEDSRLGSCGEPVSKSSQPDRPQTLQPFYTRTNPTGFDVSFDSQLSGRTFESRHGAENLMTFVTLIRTEGAQKLFDPTNPWKIEWNVDDLGDTYGIIDFADDLRLKIIPERHHLIRLLPR